MNTNGSDKETKETLKTRETQEGENNKGKRWRTVSKSCAGNETKKWNGKKKKKNISDEKYEVKENKRWRSLKIVYAWKQGERSA